MTRIWVATAEAATAGHGNRVAISAGARSAHKDVIRGQNSEPRTAQDGDLRRHRSGYQRSPPLPRHDGRASRCHQPAGRQRCRRARPNRSRGPSDVRRLRTVPARDSGKRSRGAPGQPRRRPPRQARRSTVAVRRTADSRPKTRATPGPARGGPQCAGTAWDSGTNSSVNGRFGVPVSSVDEASSADYPNPASASPAALESRQEALHRQ